MLTTFETREALMSAVADRLAEALQNGVKTRGRACAALSGGSTPEPAYRLLAEKPLDWASITFALVDERFVDLSDAASNQVMLMLVAVLLRNCRFSGGRGRSQGVVAETSFDSGP